MYTKFGRGKASVTIATSSCAGDASLACKLSLWRGGLCSWRLKLGIDDGKYLIRVCAKFHCESATMSLAVNGDGREAVRSVWGREVDDA